MKSIKLLKELEKYAVFNNKVVRGIIKKNRNYTKLLIYRLKKRGLIKEISKNRYTLKKDELVIASNLVWPCYLSCWTSLRYHNLTEQLPQNIFIITTRQVKRRTIPFNDIKFVFIKVKPDYFFGYDKHIIDNSAVFIADKEKSVIDSLYLSKVSVSEIFDILKNNIDQLDQSKIIDYLKRIRNRVLISRVGYMADKLGRDFYKEFRDLLSQKYVLLDGMLKGKGPKNKKWKIIENVKHN